MQFIGLELRWFVKGADWRIAGLSGHISLQDQCRQALLDLIGQPYRGKNDLINSVKIKALELCKRFPVYAE